MRVEIWSDIACPFCWLGKRRFEEALAQFAGKEHVEVAYRSFELDPGAPADIGYDTYDMLSRKYGMSREQAKAGTESIARQGRDHGLEYNFDRVVLTNTFDAHRLAHLAGRHGRMGHMLDRLYKAYFTDGEHLGRRDTLVKLAAEVGLDREEAAGALEAGAFADEVRRDEEEAAALGIRAVPFFVINRKYGISGAQPADVFLKTLERAWSEERPPGMPDGEGGASCGESGCERPGGQ